MINENKKRIKEHLKEIGASCKEGGDTWHDNFAFEQAHRDVHVWLGNLQKLNSIRANAELIYVDYLDDKVDIGRIVTIKDEDTAKKKRFQVGSYMVLSKKQNVISYGVPLSQIIMGARVGEVREGEVLGKKKKFKIIKIE